MPRRRAFRASGSRGPKNNVWAVVLADEVPVASLASVSFNIVQDSDWQGGTGQERGTILRIRGWLSVNNKTTTGVRPDGAWFAYVTVQDEDAAVASPIDPQSYIDEDILWTGGGQFTATDTNATGHVTEINIDIKTMRKIRVGQQCRLAVFNASGGTMNVSHVLRALLRKGGN